MGWYLLTKGRGRKQAWTEKRNRQQHLAKLHKLLDKRAARFQTGGRLREGAQTALLIGSYRERGPIV
jgi:hypothetical protein